MAEVFLGSTVGAEGFSRRVAIKRVLPGFSENPAFARMFIDEARISSRLVHPNIVSVLDFDRDPEGRLYLVMELVDGRDLDGLASTGPLPIPVVLHVISEVLRGLGHAHDLPVSDDVLQGRTMQLMRGIVHRDVSPHNVLLSWEGVVKVSDFGIAKARSASAATASDFIKGKPAYMSPEQANGESLDGRSDLFAVGVMLWELLVGRRLFVGEDTRATLAAVLFGQIPRPRSLRGDIPKDVERVVMKLLERELPARYATAEHAIQDLLACDAAPKDGREQLQRTLADRFPHEAPVRHSAMRSRSASPPAANAGPASPAAAPPPGSTHHATIADGNVGRPTAAAPAAALPSLGALRAAATATMEPAGVVRQPRAVPAARPVPVRSPSRAAMAVAGTIAGLVLLIVIIVAVTRGSPPPPPPLGAAAGSQAAPPGPEAGAVSAADRPGTGSAGMPDGAAAATPAPTDAGTEDVLVRQPIVGEAPREVAPHEPAKKDATGTRPGEKRMGRLQVRAFPVLTVYVDNKKIRDTPVDMQLPAGKHRLRLVNTESGKNELLTVTIDENQTTTIDRN